MAGEQHQRMRTLYYSKYFADKHCSRKNGTVFDFKYHVVSLKLVYLHIVMESCGIMPTAVWIEYAFWLQLSFNNSTSEFVNNLGKFLGIVAIELDRFAHGDST